MRGRIAKCVLGLCLIISAIMRPEIGLHLPGYLADLFLGPVAYGATGLTWALMLLAGIGLVGGFRWAGFSAALALVYNLIPGGWGLSFIPFLPTLLGALRISGSTGLIVVHGANLLLVAAVLVVQIATAKPRKRGCWTADEVSSCRSPYAGPVEWDGGRVANRMCGRPGPRCDVDRRYPPTVHQLWRRFRLGVPCRWYRAGGRGVWRNHVLAKTDRDSPGVTPESKERFLRRGK